MKLTIVIIVYNAIPYLIETVEGILKEKNNNFNILLIDDGSEDDSLKVCKQYEKENGFIKVIHKENGGISSARNCGINNADGDYIWFLDSDDLIGEGSINSIINALKYSKPDILLSRSVLFSSENIQNLGDPYDVEFIRTCDKQEFIKYCIKNTGIISHVSAHIYSTKFIIENNVMFQKDVLLYEDFDWLLNAMIKCRKLDALNKIIFRHRMDNENSITHKESNFDKFINFYKVNVKWFRFFQNEYKDKNISKEAMIYLSGRYNFLSSFMLNMSRSERAEALIMYTNDEDIANYLIYEEHSIDEMSCTENSNPK